MGSIDQLRIVLRLVLGLLVLDPHLATLTLELPVALLLEDRLDHVLVHRLLLVH